MQLRFTLNPHPRTSYCTDKTVSFVRVNQRPRTTHNVLTLQSGTFDFVAGLEAEVAIPDERVPFVNLLEAAAERVGKDEAACGANGVSFAAFLTQQEIRPDRISEAVCSVRIQLAAGVTDRDIQHSGRERSRKLNIGGSLDEMRPGDSSSWDQTGTVARFEAPGDNLSLGVTERRVAIRRCGLGRRAER